MGIQYFEVVHADAAGIHHEININIDVNLAQISHNRKKMCDRRWIFGQNLVNVWVNFQFPSGISLPKKVMS